MSIRAGKKPARHSVQSFAVLWRQHYIRTQKLDRIFRRLKGVSALNNPPINRRHRHAKQRR